MKSLSATPGFANSDLVTLALAGDRTAYGQLVERHKVLVASLAYSICGDFAQSQDIAQEAFIAAWKQLSSLERPSKFKAWLCGITRQLSHNHLRQRTRIAERQFTALEQAGHTTSPSPQEQAITTEEATIVWRALEQLPSDYREPLILFYREHQSIERVAAGLDLSEDNVKQRLTRGRNMLRAQVESLIERSLGYTTPGVLFTTAVLSGLPAVASIAINASAATTTVKTGGALKSLVSIPWLGAAIFVPLASIVGAYQQERLLLPQARNPAERTFLKKYIWIICIVIIVSSLGSVVLLQWNRSQIDNALDLIKQTEATNQSVDHQKLLETMHANNRMRLLWLLAHLTALAAVFFWGRRRYLDFASHFRLPADASPWRKRFWLGPDRAIIWRSRATLFRLPLIDIRFGESPEHPDIRGAARGWIALGDHAYGLLLGMGGCATGFIAIGGLSIGAVSIGACALGISTNGALACGYYANGFLLSIGFESAQGLIALAIHYAKGAVGYAEHWNDKIARAWFNTHGMMPSFQNSILSGIPFGIGNALICLLGTNFLARRRTPALTR